MRTPLPIPPIENSPDSVARSDDSSRDELVSMLKIKVEELRVAKEEQEEARLIAEENLETALREALEFQKRCEDLEDKLILAETSDSTGKKPLS